MSEIVVIGNQAINLSQVVHVALYPVHPDVDDDQDCSVMVYLSNGHSLEYRGPKASFLWSHLCGTAKLKVPNLRNSAQSRTPAAAGEDGDRFLVGGLEP